MPSRFEDYSTSLQQIIQCIKTVEAQLREKRQEIEHIKARHEALAKELALTIRDLRGIFSAPGMLSDDTSTLPSGDQGYEVIPHLLGDQAYDFEPLDSYRDVTDVEVDVQSLKAGVMRIFDKKRRSANAPRDKVPEPNA